MVAKNRFQPGFTIENFFNTDAINCQWLDIMILSASITVLRKALLYGRTGFVVGD